MKDEREFAMQAALDRLCVLEELETAAEWGVSDGEFSTMLAVYHADAVSDALHEFSRLVRKDLESHDAGLSAWLFRRIDRFVVPVLGKRDEHVYEGGQITRSTKLASLMERLADQESVGSDGCTAMVFNGVVVKANGLAEVPTARGSNGVWIAGPGDGIKRIRLVWAASLTPAEQMAALVHGDIDVVRREDCDENCLNPNHLIARARSIGRKHGAWKVRVADILAAVSGEDVRVREADQELVQILVVLHDEGVMSLQDCEKVVRRLRPVPLP